MLAEIATRVAGREAIIAADRRITYAQFLREAPRFARALLALGVRKDDKIALWLPNRPAWPFAQYTCAEMGSEVVAVNTPCKAHEVAYILGQSEATTLVLTDHLGPVDYLETLHEVLPGLGDSVPGELEAEAFPQLRRVILDCEDPHPGCLELQALLEA